MMQCPKCNEHEMTYTPWQTVPGGRWKCKCGYIVWETVAANTSEYESHMLLPQFTKPGTKTDKHCGGRGLVHIPADLELRQEFMRRWEAHNRNCSRMQQPRRERNRSPIEMRGREVRISVAVQEDSLGRAEGSRAMVF